MRQDGKAALEMTKQRTVYARQMADADGKRCEFLFDLRRRRRVCRELSGRLNRVQGLRFGRTTELIFEQTPLAAQFRLVGCPACNHFGIGVRSR